MQISDRTLEALKEFCECRHPTPAQVLEFHGHIYAANVAETLINSFLMDKEASNGSNTHGTRRSAETPA